MLTAGKSEFRVLCNAGLLAYCVAFSNIFFHFLLSPAANAAESTFLGQNSCSSSSCHGGAGPNQNQNIVWSKHDPHSRSPATLTTARSATLARILEIKDPTQDRRCTSCHSPWSGVSSQSVPAHLNASIEAVSCETCHAPASEWLRSHTRPDLNRTQKALDGLRDLTILYNRANVCVACHQAIEPALLKAGHPELTFEMDGQTAEMPRHWREREPTAGLRAWLVGQVVALRELTAQLLAQKVSDSIAPRTLDQWQAALWIVQRGNPDANLTGISTNAAASINDLKELHGLAEKFALQTSAMPISSNFAASRILSLAKTSNEFSSGTNLCSRAERLVLALDRLTIGSSAQTRARVDKDLNLLFRLVQNRQTFDPAAFTAQLRSFEAAFSRSP